MTDWKVERRATLQDIFDAAWEHFIVQDNDPAINEDGSCAYLTEEGRKCAVGLKIPDGHPFQKSVKSFGTLSVKFPEKFDELFDISENIDLDAFQASLHDNFVDDYGWNRDKEYRKKVYIVAAKYFNLQVPV